MAAVPAADTGRIRSSPYGVQPHKWFRKALSGDPNYEDYYIWREGGPDGTPPNNWESKFGGNAWKYLPEKGKWYLHLFDLTQADLNKGFRFDAELLPICGGGYRRVEYGILVPSPQEGGLCKHWWLVPFDFQKLKDILFSWQTGMSEHNAWNAVFWCNHDQPRVVSRFGDKGEYWKLSAKMLGTVIHCLHGTPYIYQGEETGMTTLGFSSLDQYRDVESINHFHILRGCGLHEDSPYDILRVQSRNNSRTPMQWDGSKTGGFSAAVPWIEMNPNHTAINAASQIDDPDSVFVAHYQKLIALRKQYDVTANGDFAPLDSGHPSIFAYTRRTAGETLVVVNNFYRRETE